MKVPSGTENACRSSRAPRRLLTPPRSTRLLTRGKTNAEETNTSSVASRPDPSAPASAFLAFAAPSGLQQAWLMDP
ncbi:hypothetical protein EYF80_054019 [Liparis tanakae]|uniref:Uncharacterized protein n=1 Tax=Liparis tanakae TaxID=230148 RepID=A0A4Z2F5P5_9TELE|nr:hypothetical protein EYF80_054019 [Liparis tanakae]